MIRATIHSADSLRDYYDQLVAAQTAAHGKDYCAHHFVILDKAKECSSFCELGVNQGATLACALLAGFDTVTGVDRDLSNWRPFEPLFRDWALANLATLRMREQDSRVALEEPVDVLFIDSHHTVDHLKAELACHGPRVGRFILAHDTAKFHGLTVALDRWAAVNGWTVEERGARGHGHMLLSRRA